MARVAPRLPHRRRRLALDATVPAVLFASLDVGPEILLRTGHQVISTGHHRNIVGMTEVIHAFTASPDKAKAIVLDTPAQYLVIFPDLNEISRYKGKAPDGLAARLLRGQTPDWLVRIDVPGEGKTLIYRIVRTRPA